MFKVKLGPLYKCIILLILVCAYAIHSYCRHDHWQNLSSLVPWSNFDLDLWPSSSVVGAVTTFSLVLMLIKVKSHRGNIFNTLWLCHQQLASLLPLYYKVAFSLNKPFIIKNISFGFTQAFEISFISEVAAVAEHTTINPFKWMRDNIKTSQKKWTES